MNNFIGKQIYYFLIIIKIFICIIIIIFFMGAKFLSYHHPNTQFKILH